MKKRALSMIVALIILLALPACAGKPAQVFPPTEKSIADALKNFGLREELCLEETKTAGIRTTYTLRDPEEEDRLAMTWISGMTEETGRTLSMVVFKASVPEAPAFQWEDWKDYLALAAELYGGFEEADAIYNSFSSRTVEDGAVAVIPEESVSERAVWQAELAEGYCVAVYWVANTLNMEPVPGEDGAKVVAQSPRMELTIYESKAQFEAMFDTAEEK